MKKVFLLFLLFGFVQNCFSQKENKLDSLRRYTLADLPDKEKIEALNQLATYYYNNDLYKQGDSVLSQQLNYAELSNDKNLILKTYFNDGATRKSSWANKEDFERNAGFIQDGINFARSINEYDYIAIGYTRLAGIYRKRGEKQKAVETATSALINLQNIKSDSIRSVVYIELGDCYQDKGESIEACKSYNMAFDIAIKNSNSYLEFLIYHRLSEVYNRLNDKNEAKNILLQSVRLNRKEGQYERLIKDYTELGGITEDTFYTKMALSLSDSLGIDSYKLRAKSMLYAYYMVVLKDSKKTLYYLNAEKELKEYFMSMGLPNYHVQLGEIYRYANQPDSALYYFELAEPELTKILDPVNLKDLRLEMAVCYEMNGDDQKAIDYYRMALNYCMSTPYLSVREGIANSLSKLFQGKGDFENALNYTLMANRARDSVAESSKERDIALMGVERENRKHKEELRQQEEHEKNKRDIQYMGISIAICISFVCLLVIGMFPVSKTVIRILGFIFFICLFEFIVLFLDNTILHDVTHGEPMKLWLIKICLIAGLVPLQHGLEHKLIHFLESRKLLKARARLAGKGRGWLRRRTTVTTAVTETVDVERLREQELQLQEEMHRQEQILREEELIRLQTHRPNEMTIEGESGVL